MARKKIPVPEPVVQFDTSTMTDEQVVDIICHSLTAVCDSMTARGLDPELVTASLLQLFAERMCESGDRETYESVLELALEDPWEEVTLH